MATTELVKTENTALTFGDRASIKELADRLRIMMPNAQKLTEGEALAVAQVARAHELDPFTGEVWGLKSKSGEWYGVMVGIKGQRKSARREAAKESGTYWTEVMQVEPTKYGATKPGSVVYETILRDTVTVQAWSKSINMLTTCGVPYKEAITMLGSCPVVIGVGIADPSENSKMAIHARAKKRSEADAIKQRYDISFGSGVVIEGSKEVNSDVEQVAEENTIDGEVVVEPAQVEDNEAERLEAEAAYRDACEVLSSKNERYGDLPTEHLVRVVNNEKSPDEKRRAAEIILAHRAAEKASKAREEKALQELGY